MNKPRRSKPTLYQELHDRLAADLAAGVYPVGGRFPTEQELCARYSLGRHTVREALRLLEEAGLLSRQAGVGTVVLARTPPEVYSYRIDSIDNLTEYARVTIFDKKQEGVVTLRPKLAETLGAEQGSRWLRMAGLRHTQNDELPVAWTDIYISEPYIGVRDGIGGVSRAIYQKTSEQFGFTIARVERRIAAVSMPEDLAAELSSEPGAPALMERRRYWSDKGELFEITLSFHPGDRFTQTILLERET
ncbi:GntR family transcriptional regulator [Antarcticimicrobium sediminis]|uniref:GntR family transcriptional regulator n=1 Tax=Antarcticimicrobium sediminis TaxID=2546227 RepID=A0A4R5EJA5_9RHOB|nr:GntR family transcriptional regulator [Antarcticimicrobium sediminis]TDE34651.1 GntR family transcriptional regulator [Antarcticimicrobium sediminis]